MNIDLVATQPGPLQYSLGYGKDWFDQYQDNVTEWDNASCCWQPSLPVKQCCKQNQHMYVSNSHVGPNQYMNFDVVRTFNPANTEADLIVNR